MRKAVVLLSLIFLSQPAWCGLFFEPSLGYESGNAKYETTPTASLTAKEQKISGSVFGFRLGAKVASFWVGLEPSYSQGSLAMSGLPSSSYSQGKVFGLVGFDSSKWVRVWGGVGVYNNQKETSSSSETTVTSNSYKVGLGLLWHRLGASLEYVVESPTKIKDSVSGEIALGTEYSKISINRANLSLSWIF